MQGSLGKLEREREGERKREREKERGVYVSEMNPPKNKQSELGRIYIYVQSVTKNLGVSSCEYINHRDDI